MTIRDLVKASLRHRPDRLIVGEVRDGAAYDLLQSLSTGQLGSLSTLHASSAVNALNRLARLALQAGVGLPFDAIRSEVGDEIHYVAHVGARGRPASHHGVDAGGWLCGRRVAYEQGGLTSAQQNNKC